ncbi:MAG: NAD-dependent succinate-semialdehyde dehydrogenase [Chthoniobacterales bacterium]
MPIASVNPATGELIREFSPHPQTEIERRLQLAALVFRKYRFVPFSERAALLWNLSSLLQAEKDQLAGIITTEMGKLLPASVDEVLKCARVCDFYAGNAEQFLADRTIQTDATRSFVRYEPLGPVLAIMPWNFPFWQVFRFAVPAVMAGNVALLKHAANVPQCALAIEDLFARAGFEQGVFQCLLIEAEDTKKVIEDSRVRAVTLTGSDRAGSEVASAAARQIKKAVLELGGNDPFIVMPSADVAAALTTAIKARMINTGQSCIAAKRLIIAAELYDDFLHQFVERIRTLRIGDPFSDAVDLGPLATEQILRGVHEQVVKSISAGAQLLTGGRRLERSGFFYEPTVLTNIPPDSPAFREEIFGPVASFFRARDAADAVKIANESVFGLGASAWTNDPREQEFFISEIEAGMVFINGMVASDPRLPFGGTKRSGYGRELSGEGIREFVNVKTAVIA